MTEPKPLASILDDVTDIEDGKKTSLRSVLLNFGDRAFGPVLTICGLILLTPLGAIPGAPFALCVIVISFSLQIVARRSSPWLPTALERLTVTQDNIDATRENLGPVLKKMDGVVRPRFRWAATENARRFAAVLTTLLAITLLPLGVVPFGAVLPGAIIAIIGIGIMARDGLALLVGFGLTGIAAAVIINLIS